MVTASTERSVSSTEPIPSVGTAGSLMAVGVETAGVRACLVENVAGSYRLVGWLGLRRRQGSPVYQTVKTLSLRLGSRLGRVLWESRADAPLLQSDDQVRYPPLAHFTIAATPRPLLRAWVAGLSESVSLAAAKTAMSTAPVQIVGENLLTAGANSVDLAAGMETARPEVVVIAGGFDSSAPAAQKPLVDLLALIGNATGQLPEANRPTLIFAGSQAVGPQAETWLPSAVEPAASVALANLLPRPGVVYLDELAHALRTEYRRRCAQVSGASRLARWATNEGIIDSLEVGFARVVQAWMTHNQLPELHGILCASAWWFHVWVRREDGFLRFCFVAPNQRPADAHRWPPLQFVSGVWPQESWPAPSDAWWDRKSLAPMLAGIGQAEPAAMFEVLENDILERPPTAQHDSP